MTQQLEYSFSQANSNPFDEWFNEERSTEIEDDIPDYEKMDDVDEY